VLCDRFDDSTLAYQGGGRGLEADTLAVLNRFATGGLRPDLTLLLDLDPAVGLRRRSGAGEANRLDREPEAFHRRVRERYLELARREPERIVVLDAMAGEDLLETRIRAAYDAVAARRGAGRVI
jgi:dTMP kinase